MTVAEVRKKYLEFFAAEPRGHKIIPSASLVPENDPTTLFTGSGMQPLVPYLLGEPHPLGKRLANSQKCFRAEDIEEVGDNRHTTFFEMLGNWSLGDPDAPDGVGAGYWKEEQLSWCFEFLTKEIGLPRERLWVTCFGGDEVSGIPKDKESAEIWEKLGIPKDKIRYYGAEKNWWSRSGPPASMPAGEPGGPDSEVFFDFDPDGKRGIHESSQWKDKECHPNCDCGRFLEIGNSVFMEYKKKEDGAFEKLAQRNIDFGGGLERITAAANDDPDLFNLNVFEEVKMVLEGSTEKRYRDYGKGFRVILDHVRAAVFLLADGVRPSNTGQGYVLRRLLRRAIRFADKLGAHDLAVTNNSRDFILHRSLIVDVAETFAKIYSPEFSLTKYLNEVIPEIEKEEAKFRNTLQKGLKEFEKWRQDPISYRQEEKNNREIKKELENIPKTIPGFVAFNLFATYGFPIELIVEIAGEKGMGVDIEGFSKEAKKHQELSRTASAGMFKGGLADASEKTVRLHTAHHLLLKALQMVLGPSVKQRGSNITSERLRMDFLYGEKMTEEQKREVERIVNEKIAEDLPVIRSEMPLEEAEKLGAEHEFGERYPERVSVYSIGPKSATPESPRFSEAFSIEFCGGPHVARTGEIGKFRITKEEAVSAGVRRIRGVIE